MSLPVLPLSFRLGLLPFLRYFAIGKSFDIQDILPDREFVLRIGFAGWFDIELAEVESAVCFRFEELHSLLQPLETLLDRGMK
jgi:hypothetical protein